MKYAMASLNSSIKKHTGENKDAGYPHASSGKPALIICCSLEKLYTWTVIWIQEKGYSHVLLMDS
jgi:hypothetical protein